MSSEGTGPDKSKGIPVEEVLMTSVNIRVPEDDWAELKMQAVLERRGVIHLASEIALPAFRRYIRAHRHEAPEQGA